LLSAEPKQFKINDGGEILYQPDASNPLPGKAVARIKKGKSLLLPSIDILGNGLTEEQDKEAVSKKLADWLGSYTEETLESLVKLTSEEIEDDAVRDISFRLYEALGILPREDLEDSIAKLDEDGRRELRQRKVRLGPVMVFLPTLNKPASVRLRAILWGIWNDQPMPIHVPSDGIVSYDVGEGEINPVYYRTIGYPVYGNRAIRIDMLDRLIGSIYDSAEKGKFQARHEMAEWLGCSITSLYEVLDAMGHRKFYDPEDEEKVPEKKASDTDKKDTSEQLQEKPELASFRLRKGKAHSKLEPDVIPGKTSRKPHRKKRKKASGKKRHEPKQAVIMSAEPEPSLDNSPFAVLKKLNVKGGDD